ncbi:MAG: hypothetical protein MUF40_05390 [Gemmatimonadaceae bacterium]|jgi:hypothetical protein|nr:hypothetical protein [Gemmatimonadaceae bacterium]
MSKSLLLSLLAAGALLPAVAEAQQPTAERRDGARERMHAQREFRGARGDGPRRGGMRGARGPESRERREAMRAAWESMTPEQREAAVARARQRMTERRAAMPPEQRALVDAQRSYRDGLRTRAQELRAQVDAGTITRDQMAEQLKAYRDANMPRRPDAGRPGRRGAPPAPAPAP